MSVHLKVSKTRTNPTLLVLCSILVPHSRFQLCQHSELLLLLDALQLQVTGSTQSYYLLITTGHTCACQNSAGAKGYTQGPEMRSDRPGRTFQIYLSIGGCSCRGSTSVLQPAAQGASLWCSACGAGGHLGTAASLPSAVAALLCSSSLCQLALT